MRTTFRRILTTLSLIFLIVTIALWTRSQKKSGKFTTLRLAGPSSDPDIRLFDIHAGQTAARLLWITVSISPADTSAAQSLVNDPAASSVPVVLHGPTGDWQIGLLTEEITMKTWTLLGFGWNQSHQQVAPANFRWQTPHTTGVAVKYFTETNLSIPWWFLTVLFAIAPALALRRFRPTRRHNSRHCKNCGYDLRATPNPKGPLLATCPECGQPSSASPGSRPQSNNP